MENLMAELMAEAERVKKLETEVKTAEENLNNQIGLARSEKLAEIVKFLDELNTLFKNACPGEYFVINTSGKYKNGNHEWTNYLRFGNERVWIGLYMAGTGDFCPHTAVGEYMIHYSTARGYREANENFVDKWSEDTRAFTEKQVAGAIRNVLAKRIEKATADLKKVNEKHEEYYGKEND